MSFSSFLKCKVTNSCQLCIPQPIVVFSKCAGTVNYLCAISSRDLHISKNYAEVPDPPASLPFLERANELMMEHGLQFPGTVEDAMSLYGELIAFLEARV